MTHSISSLPRWAAEMITVLTGENKKLVEEAKILGGTTVSRMVWCDRSASSAEHPIPENAVVTLKTKKGTFSVYFQTDEGGDYLEIYGPGRISVEPHAANHIVIKSKP